MKPITKITATIAILVLIPIVVGLFLPKNRLVSEKILIDKMYFFILADVTNHWEEPSWRHNIDTLIQVEQVDGLDAWKEYYTNGDSAMFLVQKTAEKDYIRIYVDPDGTQRNFVITLVDVEGKTAVRISKEVSVKNPLVRFKNLFSDTEAELVKQYLLDLKERSKATEEQQTDEGGW